MTEVAMSLSASALLRSIVAYAGDDRSVVRVTECHSVDWQSLSFIGERHEFELVFPTVHLPELMRRIAEDSFEIPGTLVADINIVNIKPLHLTDDTFRRVRIEALTIGD